MRTLDEILNSLTAHIERIWPLDKTSNYGRHLIYDKANSIGISKEVAGEKTETWMGSLRLARPIRAKGAAHGL